MVPTVRVGFRCWLAFNNEYNPSYGSWTGWACLLRPMALTKGYLNQYSSFTGGGAVESILIWWPVPTGVFSAHDNPRPITGWSVQ